MSQIASNIDILMISGTEIDQSFPTSQFLIHGFSSIYRRDKNPNGGDILMYFNNNETQLLKTINLSIKAIFLKMNCRSKSWLTCFTYNPNESLLEPHLNQI